MVSGPAVQPVDALLRSVVDYAGLFPPARLEMAPALETYLQAAASAESGLLGSFVLPLARVEEFDTALREAWKRQLGPSDRPVPLSLIVPVEHAEAVRRTREHLGTSVTIGALEVPPCEPERMAPFARAVPEDVQVFFEVEPELATLDGLTLDDRVLRRLDAVAVAGECAKIRLGGIEPKAFRTVGQLAAFVVACRDRGIPFKGTAGLHHAIRGVHRTDGPTSPRVWMQGFVNLSVGAALCWAGKLDLIELVEVLSESHFEVFRLSRREIGWRDRFLLVDEILRSRRSFFQSFGSCSFAEPSEELAAESWLDQLVRSPAA